MRFAAAASSSAWSSSTRGTGRRSCRSTGRRLDDDDLAFENGLLVTSTHPQADGFAGDQVLLAPAFTSTDAELAEMVERLRATLEDVERRVKDALLGPGASG